MAIPISTRFKKAWNAFTNRDPTNEYRDTGASYGSRPDRPRLVRGGERSIVASIYNRISLDVAAIDFKHCRLDENERFKETIQSNLNNCLTLESNIDQTSRAFIQDAVLSMLDEGVIAVMPVDTNVDVINNTFDIYTMRVGKIVEWKPKSVRIRAYNDNTGRHEDVWMPKSSVAIIENPFYTVMNEYNSTMQRLIRKLSLLDVTDEETASGKLNLIIQLPYLTRTDTKKRQAENRREDIRRQLAEDQYGIAYIDGTEKITQLNRPLENNLLKQVEYLTNLAFSQLNMTQAILDGSADEQTMLNYYNRTVDVIVNAITGEMKRKFLTKTARSQGQTIMAFRDPFRLVPVNNLAEITDKFTRNEVLTSNEIRQIIGIRPSSDPKADQLVNSNISQPKEEIMQDQNGYDDSQIEEDLPEYENEDRNDEESYSDAVSKLDDLDYELDQLENEFELKHYASPYYDPVKAHEYYMKNRELKKRKSVAKLNDKGREAANYVKDRLTNERKARVQSHKDYTNSTIESLKNGKNSAIESNNDEKKKKIESLSEKKKSDISEYSEQTQGKIDQLRTLLKSMSKDKKEEYKEKINTVIEALRYDNKQKRAEIQEKYRADSTSVKEETKNKNSNLRNDFSSSRSGLNQAHKDTRVKLKEEYDEKYINELDKIRSDRKFQKVSTRKKSSKTTKSSKTK